MNYSKLMEWSRPLSAYAALSGGVNAWGLGGMGATRRGGFGSGASLGGTSGGGGGPVFVPDVTPAPYRTTTQTMITGRGGNAAIGVCPQLDTNFLFYVPSRLVNAGGEGWVLTVSRRGGSAADVVAAGTAQAITLGFTGITASSVSVQNRFSLQGVDKAGNRFAAATQAALTTPCVTGTGYGYLSEAFESLNGQAMALAVQYTVAGNIELLGICRGQRPRALIRQACTWTGTDGPMDLVWGGSLLANGNASIEEEEPIILCDRALSENELAQLSLGINPETLNAAAAKGRIVCRFASITNGGTASADTVSAVNFTNGQTITINGEVFTAKTTPAGGNDFQIAATQTATLVDATADTISLPICPANGTRGTVIRGTMPGGLDAIFAPYVISSSNPGGAGTVQLSLTPGGSAINITSAGTGAITWHGLPATLDNLTAKINASVGAAAVVTAAAFNIDHLILTHKTAGGTSVTVSTTATCKLPTNARLGLALIHKLDYSAYAEGFTGACGMPRTRTAAPVVPTLGELAPNTQTTGALLPDSWSDGQVTHSVGGVTYGVDHGIYTGNEPVSGGQIKFYTNPGGSQVQDFAAYTSFVTNPATKEWTGYFTCPANVLSHFAQELKKTGSTQITPRSQVRFAFGKVIEFEGRSHESDFLNTYAANDVAPGGLNAIFNATTMPVQNGYPGFPLDGRWHRFDVTGHMGAGIGVFTEKVSAALNCPVGVSSHALGGVSFATMNTPTYWQNRYNAVKNNTRGDEARMPLCDMHITHSGEPYGSVATGLCSQWYANFLTYFNTTGHAGLFTIQPSLTLKDSVDDTSATYAVRAAHLDWLDSRIAAGDLRVWHPGEYQYWFVTNPPADGVHSPDKSDTKTRADLVASGYINACNGVMDIAIGSTIGSVARIGGGVYDITWGVKTGATGLQTANGAANITGIDFALASSNFLATQSSVTVNAGTDVITFASNTPSNGDPLVFFFDSGGSQPAGIPLSTRVYARDISGSTCKVALTSGGAAIDVTTNGSLVYAQNVKALLVPASHVITANPLVTRVTFSPDPGAIALLAMVRYGRPGYQDGSIASSDPSVLDQRSAMTEKLAVAQDNPLCDNYSALTQFNTRTIGRLAKTTTTPFAFS